MNLVQTQERLKDVPLRALEAYANGANPMMVPPYLAVIEMNRRQRMEQTAAQPPQGTVKDKLEGDLGVMALKKQMASLMQMQPQVQSEPPEMGGIAGVQVPEQATEYGSGGIVAFAVGGDKGKKKDDDDEDEPISIPGFETSGLRAVKPREEARPSAADLIPGQSVTAPPSTGEMPGEVERNLANIFSAMPGATAVRTGAARLLGPAIGAMVGSGTPPEERGIASVVPTQPPAVPVAQPRVVSQVPPGGPQLPQGIAGARRVPEVQVAPPRPVVQAAPQAPQAAPVAGVPAAAQAAPSPFAQMLMDMATGKGQQTYEEKRKAAEAADPYLKKQPGEMMEQYIQRMQQRDVAEEQRFKEMQAERAKSALFRALQAAGEASRGQRGLGALASGFGRVAGEEVEAGRVREEAQIKLRREREDAIVKMQQEIENARIARAQGRFDEALKHDQKAEEQKNKAIEKGAEIESYEKRDAAKFANEKELAALRFGYEKKLKAIPQAERPSLEREYVEALVKKGVPREKAIEQAKMLGAPGQKGVMTRDQAEDNFRKDMENI